LSEDQQAERPDVLSDIGLEPTRKRGRIRFVPMLPSMLTLGNLFCGFLAISYTSDAVLLASESPVAAVDKIATAGWVVFIAIVFDALDGRVARMTGQVSEFGAELDSLADMVTFGVAPAFMVKALAEQLLGLSNHRVTLGFCVFYVLCAGLRLARNRVESDPEEEGTEWFLGLPSTAAGAAVAGVALFYSKFFEWSGAKFVVAALPFFVPFLGILMISRIPYPHFMNRFFRGAKPMKYLVFLALVAVVAIVLQSVEAVLAGLICFYVLVGPVSFLLKLVTGRARRADLEIFD